MNSKDFNSVWKSIKRINEEMGDVKEDVASMKTDIKWLVTNSNKIESRLWYVVTGILITIGVSIVGILI